MMHYQKIKSVLTALKEKIDTQPASFCTLTYLPLQPYRHSSFNMTSSSTTSSSPNRDPTSAPPPYTVTDSYSLVSTKLTSKSIIAKLLPRKSTEAPSSSTCANAKVNKDKEVENEEAKQAARAMYFSTL
ncbi:hypothetical protein GQ44DRAFT_698876 [Phaeosphaeriaceae sp. PMI808]|nr:hypothetical protein GQ44DRAFT_698876 [Phaeosphaeriaceae sp. PMI808]